MMWLSIRVTRERYWSWRQECSEGLVVEEVSWVLEVRCVFMEDEFV